VKEADPFNTADDYRKMVNAIKNSKSSLTAWEVTFIADMGYQIGQGETPTFNQQGIIERIYEERMP